MVFPVRAGNRGRRSGRRLTALLTGLAMTVCLAAAGPATAHADEVTVSQDNMRTGWDQNEAGLSLSAVSSSSFGQMFSTAVDGQVYAQPLAVDGASADGTLVVATENDDVYGIDKLTGAVDWTTNFGAPWPASTISCDDLQPNIGITSTPVYDPATNAVYLTSKVNDGANAANPHWYMQAINPSTGAELPGWPVTIQGSPTNDPGEPFNPEIELQRPGLLLLDGVVYAAFGSDCDFGSYRGYVVGVSTTTHAMTTMWTDEATTSDFGGGIWQAGGGLVSDGDGRIFVATGNGISAPDGPGDAPPPSLSESVVRLQVNSDGSLTAADFFSPANAPTLDANDTDLASGGPVALPDSFGTAAVPHLMVMEGKDGRVFLLNRDDLGGRAQGPGGTDAVVGVTGPIEGEWGHPAVWGGDGGYVYIVGNGGPLRALKDGVSTSGLPALTIAGASTDNFGYTSGSPVVTSDGTTSGSALVWVVWSADANGDDAQLRAYNAVPDDNGILDLVYSVPIGTASKFTTPATDGNRVYLGTRDGHVLSFGSPANTPVTVGSVNFGTALVGTSASATATLTANQNLTVTGVTTSAPFGVGSVSLPQTLTAGSTLQVPLTYTPTAVGSAIGVLSVATSVGTVGVGLDGNGTKPGLSSAPSSLTFADQPTNSSNTQNIDVMNTSTADETISAVSAPDGSGSPFTVSGLPAVGTTVAQGNSFVISVAYAPTAAETDSATVAITSTSGTLSIPLSGTAVAGAGDLALNTATTDFGNVQVGSSSTQTFTLTNTGNIPVTISKAKAPDSEFTAALPMSEGLVVGPGETVTQAITFTPTAAGASTDHYEITGADGQGELFEYFAGTGFSGPQSVPIPTATDWTVNGTAALTGGGEVQLTTDAPFTAGSSFYNESIPTDGLTADFTAQLGPGTGADGLTFALADATDSGPTAIGADGGGLGFVDIPGYAVVLDTFENAQAGSDNYVGILGPQTSDEAQPDYLATAVVPTPLRAGPNSVEISYSGGDLDVTVDGTELLETPIALPAYAYAGFTAGNGGGGDVHAVSDVNISYGTKGTTPPPPPPPPTAKTVTRLWGGIAIETATAISGYDFADNGTATDNGHDSQGRIQAQAVVLSRSDKFYDALAGSALAAQKKAPLLITPPSELNAGVQTEIARILPKGGTVYLLGGTLALSQNVQNTLQTLGYHIVRFAGGDLYDTATLVDQAISPDPSKVIVATGLQYYDALSAGAAAGANPGTVVVLTHGTTMPTISTQYLNSLSPSAAYGAGGPGNTALDNALASHQLQWKSSVQLTSLVGGTAPDTSLLLAQAFFGHPADAALATSHGWYDALTGGAAAGLNDSPLLLTAPGSLYGPDADYIKSQSTGGHLNTVLLFGGTAALPQAIQSETQTALG
jgi:hypothetical protein